MRRSLVVRLTLLPMLATAAVVHADPEPPLVDPQHTELSPPGMNEEVLTPPGLTPPLDCRDDPDWDSRDECQETGVTITGGIVRGGFGHYFWGTGG